MAHLILLLDGEVYRASRLCALDQHDLLAQAEPFLDVLRRAADTPDERRLVVLAEGALAAAEILSDADTETLLAACLRGVERAAGEAWVPVYEPDVGEIGGDLDGMGALRLAVAAVWAHLGPLLTREAHTFEPEEKPPGGYHPVALPLNRGWLLAPVEHGMIGFERLLDGSVDLTHVALMNEALAVRAENTNRLRRAAEDEARWRAQSR